MTNQTQNPPITGGGVFWLIVFSAGSAALCTYLISIFASGLEIFADEVAGGVSIAEQRWKRAFALSLLNVPLLWGLCVLLIPELQSNWPKRISISLGAAFVGGFTYLIALSLIPILVASSESQNAGSFGPWDWIIFAFLPAFGWVRLQLSMVSEVRAAQIDDAYIDLSMLDDRTRAIIRKYTNGTMKRTTIRPALIGDGGRLTARDIQTIMDTALKDTKAYKALAIETRQALEAEVGNEVIRLLADVVDDLPEELRMRLSHKGSSSGGGHKDGSFWQGVLDEFSKNHRPD